MSETPIAYHGVTALPPRGLHMHNAEHAGQYRVSSDSNCSCPPTDPRPRAPVLPLRRPGATASSRRR